MEPFNVARSCGSRLSGYRLEDHPNFLRGHFLVHSALIAMRIRNSAVPQALEGIGRGGDNDAVLDEFCSAGFRMEDASASRRLAAGVLSDLA